MMLATLQLRRYEKKMIVRKVYNSEDNAYKILLSAIISSVSPPLSELN